MRLVSSPTTRLQEPVISSPTCLFVAEVAADRIYPNLVADHSHETPAPEKEKWPLQILKATVRYVPGTNHMVHTSLSDLIYTCHGEVNFPQAPTNRPNQPHFSTYQKHGIYPYCCWLLAASRREKAQIRCDHARWDHQQHKPPVTIARTIAANAVAAALRTPTPVLNSVPLINRSHRPTATATHVTNIPPVVGPGREGERRV